MTSSDIDKSQIRYARLAGFMYLFVDVAYGFGLLLLPVFRFPEISQRPPTGLWGLSCSIASDCPAC